MRHGMAEAAVSPKPWAEADAVPPLADGRWPPDPLEGPKRWVERLLFEDADPREQPWWGTPRPAVPRVPPPVPKELRRAS